MIADCRFALAVAGFFEIAAAHGAPTLPQYSHDGTLGVGSCANSLCHGAIETWKDSRVLQNEYVTWSRSDMHARAYAVLLNDRSKEITKKLALPAPAQQSKLCLDCHTHNPEPAPSGHGFQITDGVTCEACHGPAARWIKTHVERGATHEENVVRGMYPVDNDVDRALLCMSCHVGTQEKFVTHKMMAAGHPRMSFELDTFTQIEPAHYKVDAGRETPKEGARSGVHAWAIGQAVAAKIQLGLLQGPRGRDGLFPELVLFDCHACHHEMSDKRDSAARVGVGPGIVRLNDSSLLMLRQIVRRVAPEAAGELATQVALLQGAIATGGDALGHAHAVERQIELIIPQIDAHRFTGDDARSILNGVIDDGLAGQYTDYAGAEQAVMAAQSLLDFMDRHKLVRAQALNPVVKRLLQTVAHDEQYRPAALQQALGELKTKLNRGTNQ